MRSADRSPDGTANSVETSGGDSWGRPVVGRRPASAGHTNGTTPVSESMLQRIAEAARGDTAFDPGPVTVAATVTVTDEAS